MHHTFLSNFSKKIATIISLARIKWDFSFPDYRSNFLELSWQLPRIDGENKRNYAEYWEFIRGTKGMHRLILARYSYLIYQSSAWIRMGAIEAVRH